MKQYIYSNKIKLIILDLDGTLYPRDLYFNKYYDFTVKSLNRLFNFSSDDAIRILNNFGISADHSKDQESISALIISLGMSIKDWNDYRDKNFNIESLVNPNKELVSYLKYLKRFYKIVIFTNNTKITSEKILNRIGIFNESIIDFLLTSDYGLELKPHKEGFEFIKVKFGLLFSEIVSIGDRESIDIKPLLDLGGNGILISNPSELLEIEFNSKD